VVGFSTAAAVTFRPTTTELLGMVRYGIGGSTKERMIIGVKRVPAPTIPMIILAMNSATSGVDGLSLRGWLFYGCCGYFPPDDYGIAWDGLGFGGSTKERMIIGVKRVPAPTIPMIILAMNSATGRVKVPAAQNCRTAC
jgi:hypothetical protein